MPAREPADPARLAASSTGSGPRVVALHGFTQTRACWGAFLDLLAADHEVLAVDAPGHGESSGIVADSARGAMLLGATGGLAVYLGYSMGGRLALRLALDRPELVRALVLIGASPGIEDAAERTERRAADDARAARLEAIGVSAFVDEWLRQPLFATLPPSRTYRDERARNTVAGLAASLRCNGTGAQPSLWPRLAELRMPTLLVAGALDAKFAAVAERMAEHIGRQATVALIGGAGHSAHLEQPEATATMIMSWLRAAAP